MAKYDKNDVCCHHCFADKYLQEWIKGEGSRGRCPWCSRRNVYLIELHELGEAFREVAEIYSPVEGEEGWENGEFIGTLLQEDWWLFDEKIEAMGLENDLARAILLSDIDPKERGGYPDYDGFFVRDETGLEEEWDSRARTALSGDAPPPVDPDDPWPSRMEGVFEDRSVLYEEGKDFYRARIYEDRDRIKRFSFDELYAPPPGKSTAGRANVAGEPVLYLASSRSTALAEVCAWKGAPVAVAKHRLKHPVVVVDLRKPQALKSPFAMRYPRWDAEMSVLLHRLAEDLARPLMHHEEERMYRPTQYLASWIKATGFYQGFIYPSRMASGFNIVLFDPGAHTEVIERTDFRISNVAFFSKELDEHDDIFEESPYDGDYPASLK